MLEDWRKAIAVLKFKGKGSRNDCNSYKGISLLDVCMKGFLNERMTKVFQKGTACLDQNLQVK